MKTSTPSGKVAVHTHTPQKIPKTTIVILSHSQKHYIAPLLWTERPTKAHCGGPGLARRKISHILPIRSWSSASLTLANSLFILRANTTDNALLIWEYFFTASSAPFKASFKLNISFIHALFGFRFVILSAINLMFSTCLFMCWHSLLFLFASSANVAILVA